MHVTRREFGALSAGAAATAALAASSLPAFAAYEPELVLAEDAIAEFTGGAEIGEGGVTVKAPEIAENGNTVPVEFDAPGAVAVMLVAPGNPSAKVATVHFTEHSGSNATSTRIRLAKTQDVMAIAKMPDGSFTAGKRQIKVTIGGCGG